MNSRDEIKALAVAYFKTKEAISASIQSEFPKMPRAPLARLIDEFVEMQSQFDLCLLLKRIGDTNQGRIEDLSTLEFQSYLIATCETNDSEIRRAISALNNFLIVKASSANENKRMLIAARDGGNSGQKSASMNDLLRQIAKRRK
jgi:hypothetical protein